MRLTVVGLAIICGRLRKLIRIRKLATSHRLDQMRSVRMLEQRVTWMRENSFDRIEAIAEMNEHTLRCLLAGFDPERFYSTLDSTTTLDGRSLPKNIIWT